MAKMMMGHQANLDLPLEKFRNSEKVVTTGLI